MSKPTAVIVKGNSKYLKGKLPNQFYNDLRDLLVDEGFNVSFDPGEDFTCPRKADLYIMHSKGASRICCIKPENMHTVIIMGSGHEGSINHPVDTEWMNSKPSDMSWLDYGDPPNEHFMITPEMRTSIIERIQDIKPTKKSKLPASSEL